MVCLPDYVVKVLQFNQTRSKHLFAGRYYSLVLITRGTAHFRWGNERWCCNTEDLFLFKPGEYAMLDFAGGRFPLELLWVQLSPCALATLSDETTDLEMSFNVVPFRHIAVHADSEISMLMKSLARRMVTLPNERDNFGNSLFEESVLKMFVVLALRACIHAEQHKAQGSRKHFMMDELFLYIRAHITEEITLEQLEQAFFVSRHHIAREFKRQTGQTVHRYIIKAKLDLCCHYIEQGRPITEVYRLGGFGGYNHFFRAFKQEYGMTPKQYFRSVQKDAHA
ncbi:AraC family transcriptional regulator [Ruthenibacterium lactatiformans]|uniref:AraC family transcriptional regulator n=1 Tax=Ruthenibacterium lactatiformans TaxID=1550024 RepID=UPI001FAA47CB|nr:AraC family transcriptional regulator [Ruthenibacterium lactatiformans]